MPERVSYTEFCRVLQRQEHTGQAHVATDVLRAVGGSPAFHSAAPTFPSPPPTGTTSLMSISVPPTDRVPTCGRPSLSVSVFGELFYGARTGGARSFVVVYTR